MNYFLRITSTVTIVLICTYYVNCSGILWETPPTTPAEKRRIHVRTAKVMPFPTTTKSVQPIIVTEKKPKREEIKQLKVICTESEKVIKCYYISRGNSIHHFSGKTLWSMCILNFVYLVLSRYF
uniref:Uncharacterized protein n=1 Tax=Trichobilharzia regenti TaxID=157069 RepID=A0AA85IUW1_TRIRE|nr:unnamed protein product [Trichobilharzia regenti]